MSQWQECRTCVFYRPSAASPGSGQCRQRPPTVVPAAGIALTVWPYIEASDWCGEYESLGGRDWVVAQQQALDQNSIDGDGR